MPIYTYCTPDTITIRHDTSPCPRDDIVATVNKACFFEQRNDPSSRTLPNPPLWRYPTSLPLQKRDKTFYGLLHYSGIDYVCCPNLGCKNYYVHYQTRETPVDIPLDSDYPTYTNWAMQMRLKIKDESVNLASSLVELDSTYRMFSKFAVDLNRAWRRFLRNPSPRRWTGLKHVSKRKPWGSLTTREVAATHLTLTYGIKPLVSDVYDSVQMLNRRLELPVVRRFITTDKVSKKFSKGKSTGVLTLSERAICYVQYPTSWSGFTVGNPAEWIWERIPFSFVVDWMVNIGDYISSLDALRGITSVTGTITKKRTANVKLTTMPAKGLNQYWVDEPSYYEYQDHQRDILSTIPLPEVPTWQPSKSWKAVVNGLALLRVLRS